MGPAGAAGGETGGGRTRGYLAPLYNKDQYDRNFRFSSSTVLLLSRSVVLLLDPGDFSGPDWLSEHVILGHD
jgi:hypothetical protein